MEIENPVKVGDVTVDADVLRGISETLGFGGSNIFVFEFHREQVVKLESYCSHVVSIGTPGGLMFRHIKLCSLAFHRWLRLNETAQTLIVERS